jgi:spore germination protein YaaH
MLLLRRPRRSRQSAAIALLAILAGVGATIAGCDAGTGSTAPSARPIHGASASADGGSASRVPDPTPMSAGGGVGPGASGPLPSVPGAAASPSIPPSPSGAPPGAARTPFVAAEKRLKGEVFAFVTIDQVADATDRLDWAATSTVVFFSLAADRNGHLVRDARWKVWTAPRTAALIARARETRTLVVFSLSRFSWSASQTADTIRLLGSADARQHLAEAAADEVVRRGVDGVNVDFEPIPRGQAAHFTDLIRRLRIELDARAPGYQLTFDVLGHFESYDVAGALAAGADAVYLMGYHYAGTFSTVAHATAPLGGPRYSVGDAITGLRKVARADRIIVGVPYYGHIWPTVTGAHNARTTGGGGDVPYREARLVARRHPPRYDPVEAVQWSAWRVRDCATCPLHWVQLYFDDARSLSAKWADVQRRNLRGTGFWTRGFQGQTDDLSTALRKAWLVGGG